MFAHEQLMNKQELAHFVQDAVRQCLPAHQVEEGSFRRLLSWGCALFGEFLAVQGSGDMDPELTLPGDTVLLSEPKLAVQEAGYARSPSLRFPIT